MTDNIYSPPSASPEGEGMEPKPIELASRSNRLVAAIFDSLIMIVLLVPIMFFTGGLEGITDGTYENSMAYNFAISMVGFVVFVAINLNLLVKSGQTIGKKAMKIKIVDLNGNLPSLKENLVMRYVMYFVLGQLPIVGSLFSLINVLFIFGEEKRCLHDLVGKTRVVLA